jgi:hypothetical protein
VKSAYQKKKSQQYITEARLKTKNNNTSYHVRKRIDSWRGNGERACLTKRLLRAGRRHWRDFPIVRASRLQQQHTINSSQQLTTKTTTTTTMIRTEGLVINCNRLPTLNWSYIVLSASGELPTDTRYSIAAKSVFLKKNV